MIIVDEWRFELGIDMQYGSMLILAGDIRGTKEVFIGAVNMLTAFENKQQFKEGFRLGCGGKQIVELGIQETYFNDKKNHTKKV